MGGGAGDNVLVGADGAQHFKVGYGHDVIKNFNPADGDTIFSFSPLADADAGYERVDSDGNAADNGAHAKYVFANGATLVVENMGVTQVSILTVNSGSWRYVIQMAGSRLVNSSN